MNLYHPWSSCALCSQSRHSEHLGRFRGKLASDVCRRIPFVELQNGTTHIVLYHRFRFLTYVRFVAYIQVKLGHTQIILRYRYTPFLYAFYSSEELGCFGHTFCTIYINFHYRPKYFWAQELLL